MRAALVGCLVLTLSSGCNRPERGSLTQFLKAAEAALGHSYEEQLAGVPDPERKARFRVLFTRDQLAAVDAYLASQPPIGAAARREVDGYRAAKAEELALQERWLADKQYELTAAERRRESELQATAQEHLYAIGRLIDE